MVHPERAEVDGAITVGVVNAEAEANRHARVKDRIIMVVLCVLMLREESDERDDGSWKEFGCAGKQSMFSTASLRFFFGHSNSLQTWIPTNNIMTWQMSYPIPPDHLQHLTKPSL